MTPTDPRMDQRLDFLESSNRWCLFALDVAASLVNIHGRLSYTRNPNLILEEAQKYLRRLMVDFDATCFFLVNEDDHSFIQQNCQPIEKGNMMDELLDRLIEKGEFAWALNQNKTIIARTRSPDDSPVLLHVLATQCRVRGMFVAVLAHHEEPLSRSMDNLLTIILHNTAYALESAELYRMLDDLNRSLEERVHESLQQIMEQKRELEDKLTELRKVKESLAVAKEAAEAASRSKSTFLATISHEIRTPMNAIIGMNQLLLEADLPQQQREYAQIVSRAGESLMTLLNDVLDISKIEANQITIHQHPFALRSMLDGVVEILAVSAREKKLALQLKVDGAIPPYLVGDTARLRQVLFNLGINAIKFTQQGEVSLSLHQETGGRVRFSLQDSGIGISPEHLAKIFDPFTQVDNSPSKPYGGTGLGLAICRRLVDLMGGTIWVESHLGQGSLFQFILPLPAATDAPVGTSIPPPLLVNREVKRILLVEDSEDNRTLIKAFLRNTKHQLDCAENGQIGVEMATSQAYDIIFMDIQMPVMDGLEATRTIRRWEKENQRPPTPIYALTAYAMNDDLLAIQAAGCDLRLTKPISKATFLAALHPITTRTSSDPVQLPVQGS